MSEFGSHSNLDVLFTETHAELKRLGSRVLLQNVGVGLSVTTLVNEAWLKLSQSSSFEAVSPVHFRNIVASAMRQILVDFSRRQRSLGRGGGQLTVTFDEALHGGNSIFSGRDILALNDALDALSKVSSRQAALVEGRFFGGLSWAESAESLAVSESTVMREWRAARAWLAVEINRTLSADKAIRNISN